MKNLIAFIGFGEAAFHIAKGLKSEGLSNMVAFDVNQSNGDAGALIRKRAEEAGVNLTSTIEEAYTSSDFIASLTSASIALSVAKPIIERLVQGQTYVDMNAAAPTVKSDIANLNYSEGVLFCDAAIMGPVPGNGHKVPMLLSGNGAKPFCDEFIKYGMNLKDLEVQAGGSPAIKMFRSVFMKGFPQLLIESMLPAYKFGALDALVESLNDTIYGKSIEQLADTLLGRTIVHAKRRSSEMKDVITTLESMEIDASMSVSAKAKLDQLGELHLKEKIGADGDVNFKEVIKLLSSSI
jgi:3-hydroxyisobutyrate dehydrogenase-like beta-hydroxyacid dehydrogenase